MATREVFLYISETPCIQRVRRCGRGATRLPHPVRRRLAARAPADVTRGGGRFTAHYSWLAR
ncbi:hypothetical protein C6V05_28825 [Burkholderia multivorans]|nr:hypothetical protein C6V05_28825 [Burkholderia multivorans]